MENGELNNVSEKLTFDSESRNTVRESLILLNKDIEDLIDASLLRDTTKQEMRDFLIKFVTDFENDGIVERGWVTFDKSGNIIRARSEDGIYDLQNTLRYFLEEMNGKFFHPISVSLLNESQKEMREVKNAVQSTMNVMMGV